MLTRDDVEVAYEIASALEKTETPALQEKASQLFALAGKMQRTLDVTSAAAAELALAGRALEAWSRYSRGDWTQAETVRASIRDVGEKLTGVGCGANA